MKRSELKRGSKPLQRRTPLRSNPKTLTKARKLRQEVLARAESCCEALREEFTYEGGMWDYCGARASDAAHVFPRREFRPRDRYNPDTCVALCRHCHKAFDAGKKDVTLQTTAYNRAYKLLLGAKSGPTSRRSVTTKGST